MPSWTCVYLHQNCICTTTTSVMKDASKFQNSRAKVILNWQNFPSWATLVSLTKGYDTFFQMLPKNLTSLLNDQLTIHHEFCLGGVVPSLRWRFQSSKNQSSQHELEDFIPSVEPIPTSSPCRLQNLCDQTADIRNLRQDINNSCKQQQIILPTEDYSECDGSAASQLATCSVLNDQENSKHHCVASSCRELTILQVEMTVQPSFN
mmetsp:Transcript_28250/g.60434  ORF Transcript_28250/g.60434 Transcript_28250/m.60434 type:complete len:206 (-) Transcript_28250:679-1296(-)